MKKLFALLFLTFTSHIAISSQKENRQLTKRPCIVGLNNITNAALAYASATTAFTIPGIILNKLSHNMTYVGLDALKNNKPNIWLRKKTNMIVPSYRYSVLKELAAYISLSLGSVASLPLRSPYACVSWAKEYVSISKTLKQSLQNDITITFAYRHLLRYEKQIALNKTIKCSTPALLGFGIPFFYGYYKAIQETDC